MTRPSWPVVAAFVVAAGLTVASTASAQEGSTYSVTITGEGGEKREVCFRFSDQAPGLLEIIAEVGDDELLAWAHTNLNKSKKNFLGTGSPCPGCAIGVTGKVTGGGKKIRGDAIDELGGTFTFKGKRRAECPFRTR